MANLLSKFRIDFNDMIVIPDVSKKAKQSSRIEFEEMIRPFKEYEDTKHEDERKLFRI